MDRIDMLFDRMDDWRNFPDYRLELRADIFFSLYLPEVLEWKLGFPISKQIVPEFPLHQPTIEGDTNREKRDHDPSNDANRSNKVDYFALSADGTTAILIELKTEGKSRRESQDDYLTKAENTQPKALLGGIKEIFKVTKAKAKYYCLLKRLAEMGLLDIPKEVEKMMSSGKHRGLTKALDDIKITSKAIECRLVYIQPHPTRPQDISLKQFADVVRRHDDPFSQRFAHSLDEWSQMPAGNNRQ
jgi:hypothetical protein